MYSNSEDEASEAKTAPNMFNEKVFTRQYTVLKTLGQGGTTEVRLCSHRLTGAHVVVKGLVNRGRWSEPMVPEVEIMKMLSHPNIVSLLQVIETEQNIYLIMEVAQGQQLRHRVQEAGCLKEDEARSIFVQLLSAIEYCHGEGIVHRDLKPDNVIVDEHGNIKIIDFGLGARFVPGQKLQRLCGAFQFIPPEIFLGHPYDGPKVDMWALGVLLYYMVTGFVPFTGTTLANISKNVLQGKYEIPYNLSKNVRSVLGLLLTADARQRPTAQDLLSHPWLQEGEKTLTFNSNGDTSFPDPDLVAAMQNIGFYEEEIRESLKHKKFDETMATYYLLRVQACQDDGNYVQTKVMNPGVTPFPSAADPDSFPLPPRRRASEPCLKILISSTERHPLRQSWGTNAPVPLRKTPTRGRGHKRSMTAPCLCLLRSTLVHVEDSSFCTSSQSEKASSDPEQSGTLTSSSLQPRGWAKWKKRIGSCLRTLCCCMSPPKKGPRKVWHQK
ncbi:sperm motility kinase Z-like [Mastomys coucha]|uniref:sperm motility kinase Z-like n=1 Tax=Mastomys coucha TaxID=35658 RepID=UPI001261752F|nr:sperm motility kinase Z-like [Mastomys coucha]